MAEAAQNGVNVQALLDARDALTKAPEAAQFKWRAACQWKNGTHSHSTVESFFGLGAEQRRKTTFKFDADHPECVAPLSSDAKHSGWSGSRAASRRASRRSR